MKQRREQIVELVNSEGAVSFAKLKVAFPEVSEMTLRNDLKFLDQARQIVRVHGGAKSVEVVIGTDDLFYKRSTRNMEKKRQITEKAVKLLRPGTSVFLDSGTTATELARVFPDESYLIFTGGISCALELAHLTQSQVHVLGGQMNRFSLSVNGISSVKAIENVNFSIAFLGVTGYSQETGFNCGVEDENELKKAVVRKSERVVALMDSGKVGIVNTFTFAVLKDIDIVVSDDELDPETKDFFQSHGIEVL
ncbi:DeoR/GlpR family DNA-binding transcription regulator [Caproiciproducens sp. CPB-2]|uniref:DeoR/GlpR family DNA-binding transcription regulator n=1 Tax=Caproiciproducens sp. CPB-2 TaxID=3030017 RepID=UPI0023DCC99C|nr:DeoR/GlpR family DNA-binding transcription regulator [Caproiciproducens sp. CPB-2]MDF1494665.1 DeoR/GlpR family DNA-binding transcription regulator [Caproiciproducens sp. CPB-2]